MNFSLLKKIFQQTVPFGIYCCFDNPEKGFPLLSRKLQYLSENHESFKISFRKCCSVVFSGHVESSFDNPAKNIPGKIHFFCQSPKKSKKTNCSRVFHWSFSNVHLDYCFDTPDISFCQNRKKNALKVRKKDDNIINYLIAFSQSLVEGTWNALLVNLLEFFAKSWILSPRDRKCSNNYVSLQKTFKRSAGHTGCNFDTFAKNFTPKVEKFCSTTKKFEQKLLLPKKRPEIVPLDT